MTKKSFRIIFSFAMLTFVILLSFYLFMHSSFFNIDKIYTSGLEQLSEGEVLAYTSLTTGQNIFDINKKLVIQTIRVHPMVKDAEVIRHLPRRLEIKITERQMWATIPFGNEFLCVDDEGVVIDRKTIVDFSLYPFINLAKLPDRINFGQALEPEGIALIKEVWEKLSKTNQESISDFYYNDKGELVIYTINGTEIRFGDIERLDEKVTFITEIFKLEDEFKQTGTDVLEYIDLRFKGQPVVKTKE